MAETHTNPLTRWGPLAGLVAAIMVAYALGAPQYLSAGWLALQLNALQSFVADHLALAILAFTAIYVVTVALSLPGAALLSLAGAVIFGWKISTPATVIGATIGSVIVFQIVRSSLGDSLVRRAGPFASRLAQGFERDAFSYLLFLRLAPVFPFFAVNIVAGMFHVSLKTFFTATLLGIIPGSLAFGWLGSGAAGLLAQQAAHYRSCMAQQPTGACHIDFSLASLVTPELLGGLTLLALIALLPVALRWLKGHQHV